MTGTFGPSALITASLWCLYTWTHARRCAETPRAGRSDNFFGFDMPHQESQSFVIRASLRQDHSAPMGGRGNGHPRGITLYVEGVIITNADIIMPYNQDNAEEQRSTFIPFRSRSAVEIINPTQHYFLHIEQFPTFLPSIDVDLSFPIPACQNSDGVKSLHLCETPFPVILLPSVPIVVTAFQTVVKHNRWWRDFCVTATNG